MRKSGWNLSQKSYPDKFELCAVGPDLYESSWIILENLVLRICLVCSELLPNYFARTYLQFYQHSLKSQEEMQREARVNSLCYFPQANELWLFFKVAYAYLVLVGQASHYKTALKVCSKAVVTGFHSCTCEDLKKSTRALYTSQTRFLFGLPLHESFLQDHNDYWAIFTPPVVTVAKTANFITNLWYWVFLKHQLLKSRTWDS